MQVKEQKETKRIEVTEQELNEIIERLESESLEGKDHDVLKLSLDLIIWLNKSLMEGEMTISKLKSCFGIKNTSRKNETEGAKEKNSDETDAKEKDKTDETSGKETKKSKKGHGRNGASAYTGAKEVEVFHPELKPGERCPECKKGKLRQRKKPSVVIHFMGSAPVDATRYVRYDLECTLCEAIFKPPLPEEAGTKKYDETVGSSLAVLKYGFGIPFYRLDRIQKSLDIPLSDSTQWDIIEDVLDNVHPAYKALVWEAAQSDTFFNDDTSMRILSRIKEIKETNPDRKGTFTSGLVCSKGELKIALFYTGANHAGENLRELLTKRISGLDVPIQMCDALDRNLPKAFKTILCNCMNHARSNFDEIQTIFPQECQYVLDRLKRVYENDEISKVQGMPAEERLAFHKKNSKPIMDDLHNWMKQQLDGNLVEPNCRIGRAMNYMLKRRDKLTRFLSVPGAPLDNNICERALKRTVLNRKNAMFYKTDFGAYAGDMFMSIIHTCELMNVNPFHYLTQLQKNAADVKLNPSNWLPWNYTLNLLSKPVN